MVNEHIVSMPIYLRFYIKHFAAIQNKLEMHLNDYLFDLKDNLIQLLWLFIDYECQYVVWVL